MAGKDLRIDGESLLVGRPTPVVFVFGQQVGAIVFENDRGFGVELERLAVHAIGLPIHFERGVNRGQIVHHLRVGWVELERFLVTAGRVFGVEEHLVGDTHLVPKVGRHLGCFRVGGNGGLVALMADEGVAELLRGGSRLGRGCGGRRRGWIGFLGGLSLGRAERDCKQGQEQHPATFL